MKNQYQDWSTEELKKHSDLIWKVLSQREKKEGQKKQKELNINGITPKDILVIISNNFPEEGKIRFSFYVVYDGKEYDVYYDGQDRRAGKTEENSKENNWGYYPWWPVRQSDDEYSDEYSVNGALDFIPDGFSEGCENCYEFHGTKNQSIKYLNKCGIINIREEE